ASLGLVVRRVEPVQIDLGGGGGSAVGRQLGDAAPILARAGGVALEAPDVAALQQPQYRCWLQLEPVLDIVERAVEPAQRAPGRAAVDPGVGAVRRELDRVVEVLDRRL